MSQSAICSDPKLGFNVHNVLVVSTDADARDALCSSLRRHELDVVEARGASEALQRLEVENCDLIIVPDQLRHDSGLELLSTVRRRWPRIARVLMSDDASVMPDAINHAGICYLLPAAWDHAEIEAALLATAPMTSAVDTPPSVVNPVRFSKIIGASDAIGDLLDLVGKVAPTDSTILVTGETGSGKELIGRAIHDASRRRNRVFSAVNSAAFPETLLESELFGHRRGAFTGANSNSKGLFENADKGTVFLDEVAEMPLSMQAKLLRFLQTGEIRPVGGESTRYVDVRLVAATNKDLVEEVAKGNFREDLYYRLAVIPLHVPPLRERVEDIPLLARHFLSRLAERSGSSAQGFDAAAIDALQAHSWPGNVRELENVIERAVALCRNGHIGAEDLPRFARTVRTVAPSDTVESLPLLERRHIIDTLDRVGWNRKRAAELLEISTTTLWRRLKEFGIDRNHPREAGASDPFDASNATGR